MIIYKQGDVIKALEDGEINLLPHGCNCRKVMGSGIAKTLATKSPKILEYDNFDDLLTKIRPHIDGLILNDGVYRGTFLPQVWEQLPQPVQFLEQLSYKAGANPSIYKEHPAIYTYTVDAMQEKFDAILPI